MIKHLKKVSISVVTLLLALTSINIDVFAKTEERDLRPGDVTQSKTATWSDYEKGIAEISFDVSGKSAEEPLDVAIVYDNSGSMQTSEQWGNYLTSRWYYASEAAELFSNSLLKSKDNQVALIPFSDTLIDGNSLHSNPVDFFETHEFFYDNAGNPDILKMFGYTMLKNDLENNAITLDEFYEYANAYYGITKAEIDGLVEKNNTQNAIVPFTNDSLIVNDAINSLYPSSAGETNYEIALKKAQELFGSVKKRDSNKVIVMISDGKPNYGGDSIAVANALKASGVTIYTCGTGILDKDASILKSIATVENNEPFYTSSNPDDLEETLKTIRKEIGVAAEQGVIEDEINTDYFEYYADETHYPTVNGVKITNEEILVAEDKGSITWKIGNIREETKTLKFYVKIKDDLLNDELLNKDQSLLNKSGDYETNYGANLSYKEINTGNIINIGHDMESPKISIRTATMKQTYYLSDASGNIVEKDGEKVILWEDTSNNKALNIDYKVAPKASIEVDGVKYFILQEDNVETVKKFTSTDTNAEFKYRYVKQMNVTFDTNNTGVFENGSDKKKMPVDHTSMTIPELPTIEEIPSGMRFVGWNTKADGTGESFDSTTVIKKDMTLYAQWVEVGKYVVTFKNSDGSTLKVEDVYEGEDATAPADPNRTGYTFTGWDKDYTNITSDLSVTANAIANKYYVSFAKNGATSGEMSQQEFTYDVAQSLTKNAFTRDDYTFEGWLYNGKVYTDEEVVKNLTADAGYQITLVAQWAEIKKYDVTFKDSDGNTLKTEVVKEGMDATAPADQSKTGYTFTGWDKDFTNVTSDLTVTAKLEANKYSVIFDKNGATSGEMAQQDFIYDETQNLSKNTFARDNYTFAGWLYNGKVYTDEEAVKNLTANANEQITLVAQWIENEKYVVTFKDTDGTTFKTDEVYKGKDATAPANPSKTGYTFAGWDKRFTNVTSNITVTAEWIQDEVVVPPVPPTIPTTPPTTPIVTPPAITVTLPVINAPAQPTTPIVTPTPNEVVTVPTETTPKTEKVYEEETPLSKGTGASWALINLLCSLGTILFALLILLSKHEKEDEDENDEEVLYKRRRWTKFAGVITAVVSVIAFILTEDITLPMKYVDKWTLMMAIILLIQIMVLVLAKKWKNTDSDESETAVNRA